MSFTEALFKPTGTVRGASRDDLQPHLKGMNDGVSDGLTSEVTQGPDKIISLIILDAERHGEVLLGLF
jgi:hypothetical protein